MEFIILQLLRTILLAIFISLSLSASDKTTVFILHSYSQEYQWTKKQHDSFVSILSIDNKNIQFYSEYLDTKRLKLTPQYEKNFLEHLKYKYHASHPDVIYVTDDNALNFVIKHTKTIFDSDQDIPVFFSGINNLKLYDTLPKESFAGVYEVKDIVPNIELIKQFSPQTRDIWFIGDNSNTYKSIEKEIQLQHKQFSNLKFHYISDEYISKIKNKLPNKKRSFVILTTIGNLKDDNITIHFYQKNLLKYLAIKKA